MALPEGVRRKAKEISQPVTRTALGLNLIARLSLTPTVVATEDELKPPELVQYVPRPDEAEKSKPQTLLDWDGTHKRINQEPGYKLLFISGMGSNSHDEVTFGRIQQEIEAQTEFDRYDMLRMSHLTDSSPLVGKQYDRTNSTQHPEYIYYHMRKLMERYKKDFKGDKFIMYGHSMGGDLALKLADEFSDIVSGVLVFDGAIKGADIVPTSVDKTMAPLFGGDAAQYYLDKGADSEYGENQEKRIARLKSKGIFVFTFAASNDPVVSQRFAYAQNSDTSIAGVPIELQYEIDQWDEWSDPEALEQMISQSIQSMKEKTQSQENMSFVEKVVRKAWYEHMAIMQHRKTINQATFITAAVATREEGRTISINHLKAQTDAIRYMEQSQKTGRLLQDLPQGQHYTLEYDYRKTKFVLKIERDTDTSLREFRKEIKKRGLDESWLVQHNQVEVQFLP